MPRQHQEISYGALLKERGRSFAEAEVVSLLEQVLPQLATIHLHQVAHGCISLEVLMLVEEHPQLQLSNQVSPTTPISPTQDMVDLGLAMVELLTLRSPESLRTQEGLVNWEDDCVVSDRLSGLLNQMLAHQITSPAQALALLKGNALQPMPISSQVVSVPQTPPAPVTAPLVPVQNPTTIPVQVIAKKAGMKPWQWGVMGVGVTAAIALVGLGLMQIMGKSSPSFLSGISLGQPNTLFPIIDGGKLGFIDRSGKVVLPAQYEQGELPWKFYQFRDGLVPVKMNGKYGYIDANGKVVINAQFDLASPFWEGMAVVKLDQKVGYIDRTGNVIFYLAPEQGGSVFPVSEGLVPIQVGQKWGYADKTGKIVIIPQFGFALTFKEGLAPVRIAEGDLGFIDKTGKVVISPQFKDLTFFSNGLAAVRVNDKWGFIDKTGKLVINPQFDDVERISTDDYSWPGFTDGLTPVKVGEQWGYVDQQGKLAINPLFKSASSFSEGLAAVKIGETWAYIDKQGKIAINPQFYVAEPFYQGMALVLAEGRRGYIDRSGNFVSSVVDASITSPAKQVAKQEARQNVGSMNRAQQAFYLENIRFASTVPELGLGMNPETDSYSYSTLLPTPGQVLNLASAKTSGLPSYVGAVFTTRVAGSSEMNTLAFLCVTNQPSQTPPAAPTLVDGKPQCAPGSSLVDY